MMPVENKKCTECGEEKPATLEYFYNNRNLLTSKCKPCVCAKVKAYREQNGARIRASQKEYRSKNKGAIAAKAKAWYEANKERHSATGKAWREKNKEHLKSYREKNKERITKQKKIWVEANREHHRANAKAWREANKEYRAEKFRLWYAENKESCSARKRARHRTPRGRWLNIKNGAKKRGIPFHIEQGLYEVKIWQQPCHYCGGETENGADRKDSNGGYTVDNVVPCCWGCNRAKKDKSYESFLEEIQASEG